MEYSRIESTKFDTDDFLSVTAEALASGGTHGAIELFHPYGFAGRPIDKDKSNAACSMWTMIDGSQGYGFALNDGRIQSKLPTILPGEAFQYGPTGNFVRCHADGRVSMFTTDDATVNGRTVALTIGPTGLVFNAPWGNIKFDPSGFHVIHSSGARIDLGSIGGLPSPLGALSSYAKMSAATVGLQGSAVTTGHPAGIADAVAKSTPTVASLNAVSLALDSVGAALSAITAILANGAAAPASALAVTAITAAHGAILAASTTIQSSALATS